MVSGASKLFTLWGMSSRRVGLTGALPTNLIIIDSTEQAMPPNQGPRYSKNAGSRIRCPSTVGFSFLFSVKQVSQVFFMMLKSTPKPRTLSHHMYLAREEKPFSCSALSDRTLQRGASHRRRWGGSRTLGAKWDFGLLP